MIYLRQPMRKRMHPMRSTSRSQLLCCDREVERTLWTRMTPWLFCRLMLCCAAARNCSVIQFQAIAFDRIRDTLVNQARWWIYWHWMEKDIYPITRCRAREKWASVRTPTTEGRSNGNNLYLYLYLYDFKRHDWKTTVSTVDRYSWLLSRNISLYGEVYARTIIRRHCFILRSVVALAGDDFCVIAADTRLSTGFSIYTREQDKLFPLSDTTILGCSGCWCDTLTLTRLLSARMQV